MVATRLAENVVAPAKGGDLPPVVNARFVRRGQAGGRDIYEIVPAAGEIAVMGSDLEVVGGAGADAEIVANVGLQSNASVTLLNVRAGATLRQHGYKGRQVWYLRVQADGALRELSPVEALLAREAAGEDTTM